MRAYRLLIPFLVLFSCTAEEIPCPNVEIEFDTIDSREGKSEGQIRLRLQSGGLYDYSWSTGRIGAQISDLPPGEYCVTITSQSQENCSETHCASIGEVISQGNNDVDDGVTKILFLGNSHTFYNQLPETVRDLLLSTSLDNPIEVKYSLTGGWRLQQHAEDDGTLETIRSDNWDFVVLQENAFYASYPASSAVVQVYPFAEQLHDYVKDNNDKTEIIFYMTHAYQPGFGDCNTDPDICTYDLMQNEIRRNYIHLGESNKSKIAPAGIIWKILLSESESYVLFDEDEVHPNVTGSYISAATISAVIADEKLVNLDVSILGEDLTQRVLDVINGSIFDGDPDWRTY